MKLLMFWLILFSYLVAGAQSLDAIQENNKGARAFAEDPGVAQKNFLNALALEPFNEHIKMNLGVSFEASEDYDKALKSYLSIAKSATDDKLKHQAYFNAGNVSAKLKKVDQALGYFQQALEYNPESIETKTNIEILTQQQDGGGGGGEDDQENEDQDQNGNSQQNQKQNNESDQDQKQQPQPDQGDSEQKKQKKPQEFKSQKLTKDDVRKILEELKNQEQDIRAKEFEKGPKEQPNSKDW